MHQGLRGVEPTMAPLHALCGVTLSVGHFVRTKWQDIRDVVVHRARKQTIASRVCGCGDWLGIVEGGIASEGGNFLADRWHGPYAGWVVVSQERPNHLVDWSTGVGRSEEDEIDEAPIR